MKIFDLKQGTPEWLAVRLEHFTASECSAMLGISPYMSRTELLAMKKTGVTKVVNPHQQKIFDAGHAAEALARPVVEAVIGDDLFPITGSAEIEGLALMASFDGLTMMEDVAFEHKIYNEKLFSSVEMGVIPDEYRPQLEQQLMVSGANKVLFVCSDGTDQTMAKVWYKPDPVLRETIISGWKQFSIDLASFEAVAAPEKIETKEISALPPLSISILGSVSSSNLEVYKTTALDFIRGINTDLQTDEDFANAEVTVKFCDKAEKELELVKKQALSSTADISLLFKTIDQLKAEMRDKRLSLSKLVKTQKDSIRAALVSDARAEFSKHHFSLSRELATVVMPSIPCDFASVLKSKRTLESMRDALSVELARAKISANNVFDMIATNLAYLKEHGADRMDLFPDLENITAISGGEFKAVVDARLETHRLTEQARLGTEREHIRAEEQRKAQAAADAKLEAERRAIRDQEREKANAEAQQQLRQRLEQEDLEKNRKAALDAEIARHKPEPVNNPVIDPDQMAQEVVAAAVNSTKMVTIPAAEYNALLRDSLMLAALTKEGVGKLKCYDRASAAVLEIVA